VVAAGLGAVWFGSLKPSVFVGTAALTTLYALTYVAVAIAISASTATRSRAMGGALGFYFITNLLVIFGDLSIQGLLEYLLNDILGAGVGDDPLLCLSMIISPTQSYLQSTLLAFPESFTSARGLPGVEELAWYVQPEMALALLFAWLLIPLFLGVRQFKRANIG